MLNLYAYIYYAKDQVPKAISTYEQLLNQPELPEALQTSTVYTLSQLYFSQENWQKSIAMLERWMGLTKEDNKTAFEMMAQAYYQLGEYNKALRPAWKVIELTQAAGEPIKEQSYLLLRVLHYEAKEYQQVIDILEELIKLFPKKQYWMQLASIYGEIDNQKKQLNVLELAYLQGFLTTENEILTLASLLLNNDLYVRAGKILSKGLDDGVISSTLEHWRLLAQAWTMAQENEKAIPALIKAAELSPDGKLDLMLAQTYMNLNRWEESVATARKATLKGRSRPNRPGPGHARAGALRAGTIRRSSSGVCGGSVGPEKSPARRAMDQLHRQRGRPPGSARGRARVVGGRTLRRSAPKPDRFRLLVLSEDEWNLRPHLLEVNDEHPFAGLNATGNLEHQGTAAVLDRRWMDRFVIGAGRPKG